MSSLFNSYLLGAKINSPSYLWYTFVLSAGIYPIMLITAISIHFCMAPDSRKPMSRVDQAQAASGEEGDRSVKSDLQFAIPQGGLHGYI